MDTDVQLEKTELKNSIDAFKVAFFDFMSVSDSSKKYLKSNSKFLNVEEKEQLKILFNIQRKLYSNMFLQLNTLIDCAESIQEMKEDLVALERNSTKNLNDTKSKTLDSNKSAVPKAKEEKAVATNVEASSVVPEVKEEAPVVPAVEAVPVVPQVKEEAPVVPTAESAPIVPEVKEETPVVPVVEAAPVTNEPLTTLSSQEPVIPISNTDSTSPQIIFSEDVKDEKPVESSTEQTKLIADTPYEAMMDIANDFKKIPGLENLKLNADGKIDLASVLNEEQLKKLQTAGLAELFKYNIEEKKKQLNSQQNTETQQVIALESTSSPLPFDNSNSSQINSNQIIPPVSPINNSNDVIVDSSQTQVIPTAVIPTADQNQVIPTAVIPTTDQNQVIPTAVIPATDQNQVIPTAVIPATDQNQVLTSTIVPDSTQSQVIPASLPTDSVNSESNVDTSKETTVPEVRKFIQKGSSPRAILVTVEQFGKLNNSRVTQEAYLKLRKVLPEMGNYQVNTQTQQVFSSIDSNDDKRKAIESMMADANELYKNGEVAKAQYLYDEISKLNKTLVLS